MTLLSVQFMLYLNYPLDVVELMKPCKLNFLTKNVDTCYVVSIANIKRKDLLKNLNQSMFTWPRKTKKYVLAKKCRHIELKCQHIKTD